MLLNLEQILTYDIDYFLNKKWLYIVSTPPELRGRLSDFGKLLNKKVGEAGGVEKLKF